MAFQAPPRALQKQQRLSLSQHESFQRDFTSTAPSVVQPPFTPDTEEWVVFSPSTTGETNTILSGTNQLSNGSVVTTSSPRFVRHDGIHGAFDELDEEEDDDDDDESLDGADTDSLQAFHDHDGPVMLPTHDGLGMFQSSSGVTGFRSLEESLRIVAASERGNGKSDTHSRIQRWRMEQGHALMEEIERATRRRRLSVLSRRSGQAKPDTNLEEVASMGDIANDGAAKSPSSSGVTPKATSEAGDIASETFWKRITRSFIRDIIGLDDHLLEVMFGEALPAEAHIDPSAEEAQIKKDVEERILTRIAKELGELVHLYTHHPSGAGAFSTHQKQSFENEDDENDDGAKTPQPCLSPPNPEAEKASFISLTSETSSVPQIQFAPTLPLRQDEEASDAALWGIEDTLEPRQRKEYWEQDLDMRLVFSYLKSRFYGLPRPSPIAAAAAPPLHHQHPLINRKQNTPHRKPALSSPPSQYPPAKVLSPATTTATVTSSVFFGPFISTALGMGASQDRTSASKASTRSRGYYWDVATSVGSGQTVAGSCVGTGVWAAI